MWFIWIHKCYINNHKIGELKSPIMNRIEEFDRIVELLNLPHGRQLFRLKECKIRYLELEILPNPGGRFLITCPVSHLPF